MDILIASKNHHKIREMRYFLKKIATLEVFSFYDFPKYQPPKETGNSFEDNACLKVLHAASQLGLPAVADDSGLCVDALKGAPGIFSSRWAGKNATEKENRKKLLHAMKHLKCERRNAHFACCIAFVQPEGQPYIFKGRCEGTILEEERGKNGFGYDSIFMKNEYNMSFAELSEQVKNQISHRAKALNKFILFLEALLKKEKKSG